MWEEYVAERWSVIPLVINSPSHKISARLGISKVPCAVRGHQGEVRAHAPWCKLPRIFPTKCVERAPTISSLAETLKWTWIKPLDLTSSAQETWGERGPRLRYQQGNSRSCPECGTFYRITSQWHQKKERKGEVWLTLTPPQLTPLRPRWTVPVHVGRVLQGHLVLSASLSQAFFWYHRSSLSHWAGQPRSNKWGVRVRG